ncbi:MAG TPA: polysaccharide biosynthesis/export family protein [Cyclobacteriaceae bacterium]|nr:polysaccharide biosynthesis/export family protein [Cyclobacteriaceae bacterium]
MKFRLATLCQAAIVLAVSSSCYYNKRMVYFQNKDFSESFATPIRNQPTQYRLRPNDILSVKVKSSTEAGISDIFNITPSTNFFNVDAGNVYLQGYSIDSEGAITLPILGRVVVKDLTVEETQNLIQAEANKYLNNATVIVKLVSFKITVLGEVNAPGYYYAFNNQLTLPEGLGLARDLTERGNRRKVKLIRQTPTGSEVVLLNLNDPDLLKSKYYYLMPNDVLYVEPFKANTGRSNAQLLTLVFSGLTTAILVLNYIDDNRNN